MAEWRQLVADSVAATPPAALRLAFFGGANLIGGYRLYYMLQHAKRSGVARLSLLTDGLFWIEEASDWLIESGVDEIVVTVPDGRLSAALADRIADFASRDGAPAVRVRAR